VPELQLPDLHIPQAFIYVLSAMVYPRDPAKHAQFVQSAHNEIVVQMLRDADPKTIAPDAIPSLLSAITGPSFDDEIRQSANHLFGPGYGRPHLAAFMLTFVLACADAPEEGEPATLEHARQVITTAGGTRASTPGLARSSLIEVWRDFAPAAHLWAIRVFYPQVSKDIRSLPKVLAYAEELRRRGEAHRPARSRTSLLNPDETWQVASRLMLPHVEVELPKPSEMKAWMAAWRGDPMIFGHVQQTSKGTTA
jgi:hypothetical protein